MLTNPIGWTKFAPFIAGSMELVYSKEEKREKRSQVFVDKGTDSEVYDFDFSERWFGWLSYDDFGQAAMQRKPGQYTFLR